MLRSVAPEHLLVYLVGIARTRTKKGWSELVSNLGYGKSPAEHPVHVVQLLHVPDDSSGENTPWDEERRFLQTIQSNSDVNIVNLVAPVKEFLEKRVYAINRAEGEDILGLQNNLFLPKIKSESQLSLRGGFAFWPFEYSNLKTTQAEVYFTIVAILHELRESGAQDESLTQHEHVRTVLAPGCFSRFNDGVVQAAFLRAATHAELDYSHDKHISAQMKEILRIILMGNVEEAACEAAPEFLLALALGKLRLDVSHAADIQNKLANMQLHPMMQLLLESWRKM